MATAAYIEKRIAGKKKEIEKLEKKLERIRKAEKGSWDTNNSYLYSEYDLNMCAQNLEIAKTALANLKKELQSTAEKDASRNVKVILEFLDKWKDGCRKFYQKTFPEYLEDFKQYQQKNRDFTEWWNHDRLHDHNRKDVEKAYKDYKTVFQSRWAFLAPYIKKEQDPATGKYKPAFDLDRLNEDLDREATRKYDFIIERTNAIVGKITDASNLYIGDKKDLNGFIIGTRGTAKVQTVGAGGYNIQAFHFRTLIHEMKPKRERFNPVR